MVTPHCRVAIRWANNARAELPLGRAEQQRRPTLVVLSSRARLQKMPHFSTFKEALGRVA